MYVCMSECRVYFFIGQYNREARVILVDFTDGQSVYADIQAEISDLDVAVLGEKSCLTLCDLHSHTTDNV